METRTDSGQTAVVKKKVGLDSPLVAMIVRQWDQVGRSIIGWGFG